MFKASCVFSAVALAVLLAAQAPAQTLNPAVASLLRDAGAVTYAVQADAGAGVKDLYLGYDADGKPVIGLATRETKAYAPVTTLVAIIPDGAAYKIKQAEVLDMAPLKGKSAELVQAALNDITGQVVQDAGGQKKLVDAVSGATTDYKAVYLAYDIMARRVLAVMATPPDWPKTKLE